MNFYQQQLKSEIDLLKASEAVLEENIIRLKDMLESNENALSDVILKLSKLELKLERTMDEEMDMDTLMDDNSGDDYQSNNNENK